MYEAVINKFLYKFHELYPKRELSSEHCTGRGDGRYLRFRGHWWWCVHKYTHARRVWGHVSPRKKLKLGPLRSLLRPYLYPNATSPTRVHGRSNTAICQDTRQSSRGISVTIVGLLHVGPASYRRIDDMDINSFYFVLYFETSSVITRCHKGHQPRDELGEGGGHYVAKSLQGGACALVPPPPTSRFRCLCRV